jgi:hypothetical protein
MSLSCSFLALASSLRSLVWVCPAEPTLPKVTVKNLPCNVMFQNLSDCSVPHTKVRSAPAAAARAGAEVAGVAAACLGGGAGAAGVGAAAVVSW